MKPDGLMPEPRSFGGTALFIGGITALPFGVGWAALMAASTQQTFGEMLPFGLGAGILFGVLFGLAMGYLFKGETTTVEVPDRQDFVARLNVAMSQLGYHPATGDGSFLTYKPSFQAGLAAGRVSVQLRGGDAVIVGPRMYLRKLLDRLDAE